MRKVHALAAAISTTAALAVPSAAQAAPAWMVMRVAWAAGAGVVTREYQSMEDCEKAADHIAQVRTPTDRTTAGIKGAWKFSFNRAGQSRHEPLLSMLCIPDVSEIDGVAEVLTGEELYRGL